MNEATEADELEQLAEQFGLDTDTYDVSDIDPAIVQTMKYIRANTGLLGDYHSGKVFLGEGGAIIQWYARGSYFSNHDDLFHWVQMECDGVMLGLAGVRRHPDTGEPTPYAEIHTLDKWGFDDE